MDVLLAILVAVSVSILLFVATRRPKNDTQEPDNHPDAFAEFEQWKPCAPSPSMIDSIRMTSDGVVIFSPKRMDRESYAFLADIAHWLSDYGYTRVVFDLSCITWINVVQLGAAVSACSGCRRASIQIVFLIPKKRTRVLENLDASGLDKILPHYPDVTSAIAALREDAPALDPPASAPTPHDRTH